MAEDFTINNSRQLKALSHPLRLRILQCLTRESMTNEQLASALGVESGKLYFHTKKLLDAGMIEVIKTRQKGPITEKYYRAVAQWFTHTDADGQADRPGPGEALAAALELYRQTQGDHDDMALGLHLVLPLSATKMQQLTERIKTLATELQQTEPDADGAELVSFSVLLHTIPFPDGRTEPISEEGD